MRALFSCSAAGITSWRLRACVHSGVCVQSPATQTIPSAGIRMTALVGGCPTPACRCRTVRLRGLFALSSDSQVGEEAIVRATSRTSEARRAVLGRVRKRTRGGLISTPNAVARAVWSPSLILARGNGSDARDPRSARRRGSPVRPGVRAWASSTPVPLPPRSCGPPLGAAPEPGAGCPRCPYSALWLFAAGRPKQCLQFDRDGAASRVHVRRRKGLPVYCAFTVSVCENHYRTPDDLAGWTPFLPRARSPGRDETDRRSRGSCRTRLSAPQDGAGPDRVKNLSKRTDVRTSQQ